MRIETNVRLARRNRQIAQYLFFASFGLLIIGLLISNVPLANPQDQTLALLLPAIVLPLAFISTMVSVRMTNLWVRTPRPEDAIREGLKGISNKSVLYNYCAFPARHILITPTGMYAMVTRFQDGRYTVEGDKWTTHRSTLSRIFSLLRFDGIGNPNQDANKAAAQVQALVDQVASGIRVQPLIVFVDPRAQINALNPAVPVLYPDLKREPSLKTYLRDALKHPQPSLNVEQIEAFQTLLFQRL
ncbi:MAG: hypothetical protein SGI73_10605 [Chloroflexota bacterium]|nr:hypothetical protein [Chloroflexota bacterium]